LASESDEFALAFGWIGARGGIATLSIIAFLMVLAMFLSMVGLNYNFPINQAFKEIFFT
jgi:hypothetical protein